MAAFLSRTVDRTLQRAGRRTVLDQFWTPQNASVLPVTTLPAEPRGNVPTGDQPARAWSDGSDFWISFLIVNRMARV